MLLVHIPVPNAPNDWQRALIYCYNSIRTNVGSTAICQKMISVLHPIFLGVY